MNDLNTKEVSDICVSCGMCCDGTLFERAHLTLPIDIDTDANVIKADNLNLEVFKIDEKSFFKLPCHHFNKCCTVYEKVRPSVCGTFFCEPIRKYEKDLLTIEDTKKQVSTVLNLRSEILSLSNKIDQIKSLTFKDVLLEIDKITEESDSQKLKVFGLLIIKISFFRDSIKELYTKKLA